MPAQHRLVVERAALHDDMLPQFLRISELDDLEQRILDDRTRQTRTDVLYRRALLLRLLDVGVHEHGAARSQINRGGRKEGFRCESFRRVAHRVCEIFQEAAAAGRTRFIQQNRVHRAVF